ncbi:MAG: hypothetical protein JW768_12180 [Chitinispirillaceae bacterium]|nr:hypothetical protein [Chitinispirillaceae bacterium]
MFHRVSFSLAVVIGLSVNVQTTGAGGGTGALFPPITDYTARDGGFGPADVTRRTADASMGTNTVAIFRPAAAKYGQGGVKHPLIVWGNGSTNTVDIWQGFLSRVATYGFVVVAPEQTQVTADHMNQAIDYVLRLANDPASKDYGKIDPTKIGSTGYSLGGMGAITVGSNARITSTFFFASNGNVRNLKAPWAVIGGDQDAIFNWDALSTAVTGSTQPAFGAALAGIDHNRVAGSAKAQEAYIGWMRWRFMGDGAGRDMFVGSACKICTDAAFSGVVKSANFDLLPVHPSTRACAPLIKSYVIVPDADANGIRISFTGQIRPSNIAIFDLQGKLLDKRLPCNSNSVLWKPDSRGCYLISLEVGNKQYLERVMVQ